MKAAVILLVVVAVAQGSLISNSLSAASSWAAEKLAGLSGQQLLQVYKFLCPTAIHKYTDEEAAQNLVDSVQRMLSNPHPFTKGLNCHSVFSLSDFKSTLAATPPPAVINRGTSNSTELSRQKRATTTTAPASVDWRTSGYVTPVKNQGQCGSCWTFSATGAMEGAIFKKTAKLPNLSEQNLVDCVSTSTSSGCNGGWMTDAYDYVNKNSGIDTQTSYVYAGKQSTCKYSAANNAGKVTSYQYTAENNETDLQNKLATVGPIATAIDASYIQNYKSGIITCQNFTGLNHGVLLVGYGVDSTTGRKFWNVKNSWGTTWGESGYIRIAKDEGNQCGIATAANYPVA